MALSNAAIACLSAATLVASGLSRSLNFDLRWNLCLAWVALLLAHAVSWATRRGIGSPALALLGLAWLVFLPNAPYLVTDLVYLNDGVNGASVSVLTLLSVTGILIGVKSVQLVQRCIESRRGRETGWRATQVITVLSAVGVYAGRVLRWNSWNVVSRPEHLLRTVLRAPSEPGRTAIALLAVLAFAAGFSLVYRLLSGPRFDRPGVAPTVGPSS